MQLDTLLTVMPPPWLVQAAVAGVWVYEGLWCKILGRSENELRVVKAVPRYGEKFGPAFLLVALNGNGLLWSRRHIHDPAGMVFKNFAFLVLAWVNAGLAAFRPGGRVFCIASAGCTAMALAPRHPVVAVDINPAQLAYAAQRIAGAPMVRGTAESIMAFGRTFLPLAGWRRSTLEAFLDLDDPAKQREFWSAHLDTRRFRAALKVLLSFTALRAGYAPGLLSALPPRFDEVMRGRLERCFAAHPNWTNPWTRALLLGELPREAVARAAAPGAMVVLRSFGEPAGELPTNRAARDRSILWGIVDVRPAELLAT